jgi:transcriptional regulator with XRE-family HTH domain
MNVIVKRRLEVGLTQSDLAEKIGVSVATIAAWERGRRYPSQPTLQRLYEALDLDAASIAAIYLSEVKP